MRENSRRTEKPPGTDATGLATIRLGLPGTRARVDGIGHVADRFAGRCGGDAVAEHTSIVIWGRDGAAFLDNRYSRGHRWQFDGGVEVPASSSPHVVPPPMSVEAAVDPEEAFVASLSSCHMLWFLSIAARRGFVVEGYRDEAAGVMAKDSAGKLAMTLVTLRPEAQFSGEKRPTADEVLTMHHEAHERCFLANSVKSEIRCQPSGLPT